MQAGASSTEGAGQDSTSFWMCKALCWRWLFGNKIPISLQEQVPNQAGGVSTVLVSLSLRLKDLLGPVTRVKKKKVSTVGVVEAEVFADVLGMLGHIGRYCSQWRTRTVPRVLQQG